MSFTSTLQANNLREQRLQFMHNHQAAFDVEPIFPMQLFQDFVMGVEGDCGMEASCKVELDRLIASRFLLFFDRAFQPSQNLRQSLDFFGQVENRVGVTLDYRLLHQFIDLPSCLDSALPISCGIDLRTNLSKSSLKIHFRLDFLDTHEKLLDSTLNLIDFSLSHCSLDESSLELLNTFSKYIPKHQLIPQVGFDFYLDGSTVIELYLEIMEEEFKHSSVEKLLHQRFSSKVLAPLEKCKIFHIGLSQANTNPVLYYRLKDKHDFSTYFSTNSTAERVTSFYQKQAVLPHMWVAADEKELEKIKIETVRLYYYFNQGF